MWFSSADSGYWAIGYATSTDGINWTPYASNPIITPTQPWEGSDADGASVLYDGTTYEMFYHGSNNLSYATSTDGITWTKPADKNPVLTRGPGGSFDSQYLAGAGTIRLTNGTTLLYYGGRDETGAWRIGLASDGPIVIADPPVVVIPGMFASWNRQAILHNDAVADTAWKLPSFVHEYDGLIQTFRNLGYTDNSTLFVFTYDWRKKLTDLADTLNAYITTNVPSGKVNIVGHSLGGLVGRIYAQKYGIGRINKLVTVGSPHRGVPQAYKAFAGGEFHRDNSLEWLAMKLIFVLNRGGSHTNRNVIADKLPVTQDLLPIYNYLVRSDGSLVDAATQTYKNDTLLTYKNTFADIFPVFQSITGEKGQTPLGYRITPSSPTDVSNGIYPDGRPTSNTSAAGDFTVVSQSAEADSDVKKLAAEHGELVYKKENIKEILNSFNLTYTDANITEGKATKLFPDLIVTIRSPATISLERNGKTWTEDDGIIFLENAEYGRYTLNVRGTAKGTYTVTIGQITETDEYWDDIKGEIIKAPPGDQTDIYHFTFPGSPLFPTGTSTSSTTTPTPTPTPTSTRSSQGSSGQAPSDLLGITTESAESATKSAVPTQETYHEPENQKTNWIKWVLGIILAIIALSLTRFFRRKNEEPKKQ